MHWYRGHRNFGDGLAPLLAEWALGRRVLHAPAAVNGKLLTIGSVIDRARPRDVVWGSGLLVDGRVDLPRSTDVLAVRGPLTADRCGLTAEVPFGDPGVLVPLFVPRTVPPDGRTLVVMNHREDEVLHRLVAAGHDVVSAGAPHDEVVERIQRASVVFSSSLHGLVAAEAYGTPAVHVVLSDRVIGGTFKFRDYYEGTGRPYPGPRTLDEAVESAQDHLVAPDLSATVARLQATVGALRAAMTRP